MTGSDERRRIAEAQRQLANADAVERDQRQAAARHAQRARVRERERQLRETRLSATGGHPYVTGARVAARRFLFAYLVRPRMAAQVAAAAAEAGISSRSLARAAGDLAVRRGMSPRTCRGRFGPRLWLPLVRTPAVAMQPSARAPATHLEQRRRPIAYPEPKRSPWL
jgi:hypothetical protein